jgi:uncharacterized protein (TIGR00730 family)
VLPGGLGTYEELFEILTWAQLGLHAKPIVVADVDGYFAPLRELLDHAVTEGFVRPGEREAIVICDGVAAALETLDQLPIGGPTTTTSGHSPDSPAK